MADNKYIEIKGARVNNLKNVSLNIPTGKLIVMTGLSGSGKSSLAFDTLFAEGQRRYVESLSSYARQFLGRINKPDVDSISSISPAIAIEQKVISRNARSTVGTSTEIYDYLKLLYARIGVTYSPISGHAVTKASVSNITDFILSQPLGTKTLITIKIECNDSIIQKMLELMSEGYERLFIDGEFKYIADLMPTINEHKGKTLYLLIDRISVNNDQDTTTRISDSLGDALNKGDGRCTIFIANGEGGHDMHSFSTRMEADGMIFEEPTEQMFSFNNPLGACPVCEGYGKIVGVDESLVIPDKTKSVYDSCVMCWRGDTMKWWKEQVIESVGKSGFPIHRAYCDLSESERRDLWKGTTYFQGIDQFFAQLEKEKYKIQYRVLISRYTGKRVCTECEGGRLRKEATYVKIDGYKITDLVKMPISNLYEVVTNLKLTETQGKTAYRILEEVKNRVGYLLDVGLGYLTLDRLSSTLSGGESQRINLSTSLGSSLVGSMYILDEPSIGLHPRDTHKLIGVLKQLRDIGNTVIVVEHEEEMMRASDQIIDIGPLAGIAGGEIVFQGNMEELESAKNSLTADYITGKRQITLNKAPRKWHDYIEIIGARENNLKNIDVKFPLGVITCVTGVSGSGKSSLIKNVLYPALHRYYVAQGGTAYNFTELRGDLSQIEDIQLIDQNPIGRSSRSNPVTYIKAYDDIRKLYANQKYAKAMGYTHSSFSFNIAGGRCEECQGEGVIRVEMQFMADISMRCEACEGKRFKDEILLVKYRERSIYDVLEMSVDEAISFFSEEKNTTTDKIVERLEALSAVGLGYIKLGQSSSTLSGGESQRVKLAYYLQKENSQKRTLFLFDEPTTGLHFYDIQKLLIAINSLISNGHTAIIVEHNMDVIRHSDWIIDLGPEGGDKGGHKVFEGIPTDLCEYEKSYTGKFLKKSLENRK